MRYLLPAILYIGLATYVIADIAQHPDEEPYRLPKTLWVLIALFAPFVGAAAWLIAKFNGGQTPRSGRGGPRYPQGPDDDPEFRIWLREKERRERRRDGKDK
ncbi:PLD nuclease N-terminal domain-containing protein [Demequina sp.]|uniref:PLD nuclease N-terminal domain-containing protein n=1 Tax=Demequina sp. TaxID=2050685 RepID=UPI0025BFE321|nr:PLD nuclease N-terminal domain-containing protein [Demequina sp.]